jgi:hypothetical protein
MLKQSHLSYAQYTVTTVMHTQVGNAMAQYLHRRSLKECLHFGRQIQGVYTCKG